MVIGNGKNRKLNQNSGTLPNLASVLRGWFQITQFIRVLKPLVNFQVVELYVPDSYKGVLQPMKPRMLQMKPEGERDWSWFTIHALPALTLGTDDVIYVGNTRYRVMEVFDWAKYGYIEYHVIQDYQDGNAPPLPNEDSLAKFVQAITFTAPTLNQTVPITGITDAFSSIWRVYDSTYKQYTTGSIQVIDATNVKVTVLAAGTYYLVGAS